ncbi:MAG: CoA transferase [Caulobacteraceae bacterium]|nr:CoA transferase [Caulobacteraceae bacterium]
MSNKTGQSGGGPLSSITVVDFTGNAAGPSCTMMLADFGAEVIKIEPPGGDATRQWGQVRLGRNKDITPTFVSMNRNKRSLVLDLKNPADLATARDLIAKADVVVEAYAPGVAEKLGVGYAAAAKVNPKVIYCSVSGYGQTGPLTSRPGFDMLMQAFGGHMSITGERGRGSVRSGPSSIDLMTGAHGAFAIMVALRHRDQTGEGQAIDVSLYDSAVYMITNHVTEFMATGALPEKFGADFPLLSPYGVFQAKDREFYLGVATDKMWTRLCEAIGREDLGADPRFEKVAGRLKHKEALFAALEPILASRTGQEWLDLALQLGIPASLIQNMGEVAAHEHTLARDLVVDCGAYGLKTIGAPIKMSATPANPVRRPPPELDEYGATLRQTAGAGSGAA